MVVQVVRSKAAQAAFPRKDSYAVEVMPGTDCVLMITIALAIEEIVHA